MKRLFFVGVGELPLNSSQQEWVDLKYLERGNVTSSHVYEDKPPNKVLGACESCRHYCGHNR